MRSVSVRLTVFIAAAMALVLIVLGAAISTVLSSEVDQQALSTAEVTCAATVHAIETGDVNDIHFGNGAYLFGARADETLVQIVDARNSVLVRSQRPGLPLPRNASRTAERMITWKGAPAAYVTMPLYHGGQLLGAVQVGVSLAASEGALRLLQRLLIESGLAGLLLVALVGYLFARRALRPVRRLTSLATEISETDLRRRLEVRTRDEIGRLAEAFNRMLDRLESAFQRQSRFVSDASHELRTPLSVISGYAELLDRWGSTDDAVRAEAVAAIGREAQRMQRLVQDLLFLARGAQGLQLQSRYFDLSDLVAETVQEARALHSGRQIEDRSHEVVPLRADWDLLKQLLWILLDNAIKFTPEGGTIRVTARRVDADAELSVRDDGPGMPEEAREHAFERFYRADPARRSGAGVGLGLAIAKEIAEAHRGRISIDAAEGTGTTVRLLIHLAEDAAAPDAAAPQPGLSRAKPSKQD